MRKDTVDTLQKEYNKQKEYKQYISFENFLREAKEIRKAILNKRLVIVPKNKDYTLFDVYYLKNNHIERLYAISKKILQPYRVRKDFQYINVTAIGTSKTFEIIYNMWRSLGLETSDISQYQIIL